MKKPLAILLAAAMALGVSTPAFAAEAAEEELLAAEEALAEEELAAEEEETLSGGGETEEDEIVFDGDYDLEDWAYEPEGVSLFLNGDPVEADLYAPELVNGAVMVNLSRLSDVLGLNVVYEPGSGSVIIMRDGDNIRLRLNSKSVTNSKGGPRSALSAALYAENGDIYAPLQDLCRFFDIPVSWDEDFQLAYILDVEKLLADTDADFTILNGVLAIGKDLDMNKNWKGDVACGIKLTLGNGADKLELKGGMTGETLMSGDLASAKVRYDLAYMIKSLTGIGGDADAQAAALLDAMEEGVECVIDLKDGMIYLRGPMLSLAMADQGAAEDSWFSISLDKAFMGLNITALTGAKKATISETALLVAEMLCAQLGGEADDPATLPYLYDSIMGLLEGFTDEHFTDGHHSKTLEAAIGELGSFKLTARGDDNNFERAECHAEIAIPAGEEKLSVIMDADMSAGKATLTAKVDSSAFKMELDMNAGVKIASGAAELPALPNPAQTFSLDNLFALAPIPAFGAGIGAIGGADGPTEVMVG